MIQLIHGEALEELDKLIEQGVKVDTIIIDPPYEKTQNAQDKSLNFNEMWKRIKQIRKSKNIPIIIFGMGVFTADMIISNRQEHKQTLVWDKVLTSNAANSKHMHMRRHEDIILFGKSSTYNPQMWKGKPLHSKGKSYLNKPITNNNYGIQKHTSDARAGSTEKYPQSILRFQKPHPSTVIHRTEKPIELLRYLVKTFSNKGDTILDFTMGAGGMGVACKMENRNFIGIEKNKFIFEIAKAHNNNNRSLSRELYKKYSKEGKV